MTVTPRRGKPKYKPPQDSALSRFFSQIVENPLAATRRMVRPAETHSPARKPAARRRAPFSPHAKAIALGVVSFLTILLLGIVVLQFRTPQGVLTVQLDENVADSVQVVLRRGGKEVVVGKADDWSVMLSEGGWEVTVKSDDPRVRVRDQSAEIIRGQTAEVKVVLEAVIRPEIKRGLLAEFFSDPEFKNKVAERIDAQVDWLWGWGSPHPGVPDDFSVRWTGWLKAPVPGAYRFVAVRDDEVQMWLDDKRVIERSNPGPVGHQFVDLELTDQPHRLRIEFCEREASATMSLRWRTPDGLELPVPPEWFFQDEASAVQTPVPPHRPEASPPSAGLVAQFFRRGDFANPVVTRIDRNIDFLSGWDRPDPAVDPDDFAARWTGWLTPPAAGEYVMTTIADDAARVWLDGQLVIDDWTESFPHRKSATIRLEAKRYAVRNSKKPWEQNSFEGTGDFSVRDTHARVVLSKSAPAVRLLRVADPQVRTFGLELAAYPNGRRIAGPPRSCPPTSRLRRGRSWIARRLAACLRCRYCVCGAGSAPFGRTASARGTSRRRS